MIRNWIVTSAPVLWLVVLAGCANGPKVDTAAPAFSAADAAGSEVSLAALEGKIVVLDFWATWCPPCVKAAPSVQALHERFAARDDVVVVAVHYDDRGDPAAYMADHGYTYRLIPDGREVVKTYGITAIPTFLVIDRDGTVVHKQTGFGAPGDLDPLVAAVTARLD